MSRTQALLVALAWCLAVHVGVLQADFQVTDPGVRPDLPNVPKSAGGMLDGLTAGQKALFIAGLEDFTGSDTIASGLGPRMNLDSCGGCHQAPAVGGSSPAVNPQIAFATALGAKNAVPYFVKPNGPVREARFKYYPDGTPDGGVHALFVISGRKDGSGDASNCTIKQEDFDTQGQKGNIVFRIPTPVFGVGLIESIPDSSILNNLAATTNGKATLGIGGRPNRVKITGSPNTSGNDGTVTRFGWKAQNKSLLIFAGEAYNVEQGISNELFSQEREETSSCQFATVPNDTANPDAATPVEAMSGPEKFAAFMRFLAPPIPSKTTPGGAPSIYQRQEPLHEHRLRVLPHADPLHGQHHRGRPPAQAGKSLLGPRPSLDGAGARRRHCAGRGGGRRVSDGAPVGTGAAHLLPPRRPYLEPGDGDPRPQERGQPGLSGLRGQSGHRQLHAAQLRAAAGPAQLLAIALGRRARKS